MKKIFILLFCFLCIDAKSERQNISGFSKSQSKPNVGKTSIGSTFKDIIQTHISQAKRMISKLERKAWIKEQIKEWQKKKSANKQNVALSKEELREEIQKGLDVIKDDFVVEPNTLDELVNEASKHQAVYEFSDSSYKSSARPNVGKPASGSSLSFEQQLQQGKQNLKPVVPQEKKETLLEQIKQGTELRPVPVSDRDKALNEKKIREEIQKGLEVLKENYIIEPGTLDALVDQALEQQKSAIPAPPLPARPNVSRPSLGSSLQNEIKTGVPLKPVVTNNKPKQTGTLDNKLKQGLEQEASRQADYVKQKEREQEALESNESNPEDWD